MATAVQKFARTFGIVYLAVGLLGFVEVGLGGTTSQTPSKLLGIFGITAVHNLVHLAVGAAFLAGSTTDANARSVSTVIGAVYLLVGLLGLTTLLNGLLAINLADNLLHFATGILALYFGLGTRAASTA
jgi:hypothetical protein